MNQSPSKPETTEGKQREARKSKAHILNGENHERHREKKRCCQRDYGHAVFIGTL